MSDLIVLTPDNVKTTLPDVPRLVRLAFHFAARLRYGTLDVTLPDGRKLRCGGLEPGPAAQMTIYNYDFAWRLARSGDLGIAEAYLRREWDTPNLTEFLYIFCVNHELIQTMLGNKPIVRLAQSLRHWLNRNTKQQAQAQHPRPLRYRQFVLLGVA